MKDNYIHLCFVIDESGSMIDSTSDVVGGFKKLVDEQKAVKDGKCSISLYTFASKVNEVFVGKDVSEVKELVYNPGGLTSMNDGVGTAIDATGKWLESLDEAERPSKVLMVIMTDGRENNSHEYTMSRVKEMIKHQEEKYSWSFMYLGADLNDMDDAYSMGMKYKAAFSKNSFGKVYGALTESTTHYRKSRGISNGDYEVTLANLMDDISCNGNK
ncbi:MAG: VWA domain-containing protein [Paludibacteraceae bacterium]|nr:VWA domain-containing protein [Paludibacteraceae bacterium]